MKKLIFTAIAMIVFSGISRAGDIAEKKDSKKIYKKAAVEPNCDAVKFFAYSAHINRGFSQKEAEAYSYAAYFFCMGEKAQSLTVVKQ